MLRVRLVGGLRLELDGGEIAPPRSRRARALLAWLALHPGMHPRGGLAARFWPDVLDESARASLRAALTELRGALGDGAVHLLATRDAVGLEDGDAVWVDVREIDRRLAGGRLEDAIAVGSGELLAGMDDDWVLEARDAHAARLAEVLEQLAEHAEHAGDHADAVRRTRAALALDPLAEETGRRLMRRLAAAGDRAAAIAAYEQLAERLRTALGIAPSAATRALADEIRREGVTSAGVLGEVRPPAALGRIDETPFVGRARELEHLRAAWAGVAMHHTRRLVLLAGEPGIGKTHLMLRFGREIATRPPDSTVLLGRCSEEPLSAYEPFADVLRHCAAALGAGSLAALAGPGADELDRLLGQALAEPEGDAGARHRLFDAVDATLSGIASQRPLLLLIDDVHWADRPTVLLLGALLRSPRRSPVLIVGTCRDTDLRHTSPLTAALADMQRDRAVDRLALSGLDPTDVAALAESRLGTHAAARVADAVHARTGGNAFFVEEVLRGLAEHESEAVPESVRQSIGVRLARLGEDAEELLAVASILGLELDLGVLEAVAGLPGETAEAALDELVGAHLLRPVAGSTRRVEFPHALVRDAVDAELNALRRSRLHRRAADVLIEISEDRHLEAIAHHLTEAAIPGDADRVVDYLTRAGARAAAMLAYEEAARLFARAADALVAHGSPDDPREGPLSIARGDALLRAGDPDEARECFAAAAALARRTGNPELLARAALGETGLGVAIIDVDVERIALLDEALAAVGDRDPLLSSQLLARLAVEHYYAPTRDRSEALSAEAVAVARSARDARAVAAALNARHVALWRPDRLHERLETADEMIEAAHAAGERHLELQAHNWRAVDLFELGDMAAWRAEVRRHGALAEELRLPAFSWYTPLWAAVEAAHSGRFAEAHDLRAQALEAGERAGDRNARLFDELLVVHEAMLRFDLAPLDLDYVGDKVANSPAGMSWRCGLAWYLAALGRVDEAREELAIVGADDFARLPFDANWPSAMGECAETCFVLGEPKYAAALYELLVPYADRPLTAGRAVITYGSVERHLGGLAALLGRPDEAVVRYERAITVDAAAGLRPWVVRARFGLARALSGRGDADRAAEVEDTAVAEARELGLTGLLGSR